MVIGNNDLLVDALLLVLHTTDSEARATVRQLITACNDTNKNVELITTDYSEFYIHLIEEVMAHDIQASDKSTAESFILKFKLNPVCMKDPDVFTTLRGLFSDATPFDEDRKEYILRKIRNSLRWDKDSRLVRRLFGKLQLNITDPDEQVKILREVTDICSEILNNNESLFRPKTDDVTARVVDFADPESVRHAFEVYDTRSVKNKFITGLHGLNKALGGGFPMGTSIVFNSRAHNAKTLMLLKMARWQIMLNKPTGNFTNPTVLFYSLENEVPDNLVLMFNDMWIQRKHCLPPSDLTISDKITFVNETVKMYGWNLFMERRIGQEFGFFDLRASFEDYVRRGYTPLMVVIDYANMMSKGANISESSTNNLKITELYNSLCNYLSSHNCTFVTAHQLNRRADEAVSANPLGAVKRFGASMLSDSISVQREVDVVVYQNKEVLPNHVSFMTYKVDKNRYFPNVDDRDKYFAYPFFGEYGILDDVDGRHYCTKDIVAYPYVDTLQSIENDWVYHGEAVVPPDGTNLPPEEQSSKPLTDDQDLFGPAPSEESTSPVEESPSELPPVEQAPESSASTEQTAN